MAERGTSVKYSVNTRHRSNTFAILNIVGEQYNGVCTRSLADSQKGKRRVFPGGFPTRGPFFLSPSPSYLENIPGPSLFLLRLFFVASRFPFSSTSRFEHPSSPCVEIRLGLLINIKTSDSPGYVGWFFSGISSVNRCSSGVYQKDLERHDNIKKYKIWHIYFDSSKYLPVKSLRNKIR